MTYRLGITGGIGTGKSGVSEDLRALGIPVVSADDIAREVMAPNSPLMPKLRDAFGIAIVDPDGGLDRAALGQLVFADADAREKLNGLVQPAIRQAFVAAFGALTGAVIAAEVPLLYEQHYEEFFDGIVVAVCPPDVQEQRVMARDGLDLVAARQRIAAQMPLAEKVARADFAVDTDGPVALRQIQVQQLMNHLAQR